MSSMHSSPKEGAGDVELFVGVARSGGIVVIIENHSDTLFASSDCDLDGNCFYVIPSDGRPQASVRFENTETEEAQRYVPTVSVPPNSSKIYYCGSDNIVSRPHPFDALHYSVLRKKNDTGEYKVWLQMINWIDFEKSRGVKCRSNELLFYVGNDGTMTFVNSPSALSAFQRHGIEIDNSAAQVEVEQTAEGNYLLHKITPAYRAKKAVERQYERYPVVVWIVMAVGILGAGYFILKRIKRRKTAVAL